VLVSQISGPIKCAGSTEPVLRFGRTHHFLSFDCVSCGSGPQHPFRARQAVRRIALDTASSSVGMSNQCCWVSSWGVDHDAVPTVIALQPAAFAEPDQHGHSWSGPLARGPLGVGQQPICRGNLQHLALCGGVGHLLGMKPSFIREARPVLLLVRGPVHDLV
jgi:hypothetical protein